MTNINEEILNNEQFFKYREDIRNWLDKMLVCNYIINSDLTVSKNTNYFSPILAK